MVDLSKLSKNIRTAIIKIAGGDGKNKKAIDSQTEYSQLSRLLANCDNETDYKGVLELKTSYQNKLQKNAKGIAQEFYQIADDDSGSISVGKMFELLNKKVNADNIVAILDEYNNPSIRKNDSSIIDTVTSETGATSLQQRKVLIKILDTLCEAARKAGVSEDDINNARKSFVESMEKEFSAHFRRTNPKDMEKAIDFLRGAILAKQNEIENVNEDKAMQSVARGYQEQNTAASEEFETARKEEGWTAKTGDWVCGLFGCNTEDELRAKLGDNAEKVDKLIKAANSGNKAEFKKIYKELFGIEFDANKIAAAQEYAEKFEAVQSADIISKVMGEILAQSDKLDYKNLVDLLKGKLKYDDEAINQILKQCSEEYNLPIETDEQKRKVLEQFLHSTKDNCDAQLKVLLEGETIEQMAHKAELLSKAAYGTNDIAKDVTQFNENMVMTEMVTDAAFEIAGTVALQFVPGLGQVAAAKLAVSAARWGTKAVKLVKYAEKAEKGFKVVNKFMKGEKFVSKAAQKGMQVGTQMVNAGVATATVETTSGKDLETVVKKTVMNMSFAGVGVTSNMIAPKLMQALGINKQLATEIAEELINAAGSYGVTTAAGGEYGTSDFWIDMATGIIMSRLAHVKGGKDAGVETNQSHKIHDGQSNPRNIDNLGINKQGFNKIKNELATILENQKTDLDKLNAIHKYFQEHSNEIGNLCNSNNKWSFGCERNSQMFKTLCDELGIGGVELKTGRYTDAYGRTEEHMWNEVTINGKTYVYDMAQKQALPKGWSPNPANPKCGYVECEVTAPKSMKDKTSKAETNTNNSNDKLYDLIDDKMTKYIEKQCNKRMGYYDIDPNDGIQMTNEIIVEYGNAVLDGAIPSKDTWIKVRDSVLAKHGITDSDAIEMLGDVAEVAMGYSDTWDGLASCVQYKESILKKNGAADLYIKKFKKACNPESAVEPKVQKEDKTVVKESSEQPKTEAVQKPVEEKPSAPPKEEFRITDELYAKYEKEMDSQFFNDDTRNKLVKLMENYPEELKSQTPADFNPTEIYQLINSYGINDNDLDRAFNLIKERFHSNIIKHETYIKTMKEKYKFSGEDSVKCYEGVLDELKIKMQNGDPITEFDLDDMIDKYPLDNWMHDPQKIKNCLLDTPEINQYLNDNLHYDIYKNDAFLDKYGYTGEDDAALQKIVKAYEEVLPEIKNKNEITPERINEIAEQYNLDTVAIEALEEIVTKRIANNN